VYQTRPRARRSPHLRTPSGTLLKSTPSPEPRAARFSVEKRFVIETEQRNGRKSMTVTPCHADYVAGVCRNGADIKHPAPTSAFKRDRDYHEPRVHRKNKPRAIDRAFWPDSTQVCVFSCRMDNKSRKNSSWKWSSSVLPPPPRPPFLTSKIDEPDLGIYYLVHSTVAGTKIQETYNPAVAVMRGHRKPKKRTPLTCTFLQTNDK